MLSEKRVSVEYRFLGATHRSSTAYVLTEYIHVNDLWTLVWPRANNFQIKDTSNRISGFKASFIQRFHYKTQSRPDTENCTPCDTSVHASHEHRRAVAMATPDCESDTQTSWAHVCRQTVIVTGARESHKHSKPCTSRLLSRERYICENACMMERNHVTLSLTTHSHIHTQTNVGLDTKRGNTKSSNGPPKIRLITTHIFCSINSSLETYTQTHTFR